MTQSTVYSGVRADIIRQAQQRVSRQSVDELATLSGLSKKEIAGLIGLTERAIFKTTTGQFSVLISEHVLLLRQVFGHGLAVFDQRRKPFTRWLSTPLAELASFESGYAVWPVAVSGLPLDEISTKAGPYDLMAISRQRPTPADSADSLPPVPYPTPLSLLNTTTGVGIVDDVLIRIEAGVYS